VISDHHDVGDVMSDRRDDIFFFENSKMMMINHDYILFAYKVIFMYHHEMMLSRAAVNILSRGRTDPDHHDDEECNEEPI
jgi:hypothetical protein